MGLWVPGAWPCSPVQAVTQQRLPPFALGCFLFLRISAAPRGSHPSGWEQRSPHPDGCWELAAALVLNHPRGAAEKMPCLGPGACSGGADTFPPAPGDPAGLVRSPRAVSRWGPFQLPARPSLSPLVILFIFSDVGNEVMKSAPSEPGFNTAPCLGPGCFTSGAANPSLSSCQP